MVNKNIKLETVAGLFSEFKIEKVNQPISLYEGKLTLIAGEKKILGQGKVFFDWGQYPDIFFEFTTEQSEPLHFDSGKNVNFVELESIGISVSEILFQNFSYGEVNYCSGIIIGNQDSDLDGLKKVIFYMPNFRGFRGAFVTRGTSTISGRMEIKDDEWSLVLDPLDINSELESQAKKRNGNLLTHVGEIRRNDNKLFSVKKVCLFLDDLAYTFSLLNKSWTYPLLSGGFNEAGKLIWRNTSYVKVMPFASQSSLIPKSEYAPLERIFSGYKQLKNTVWEKEIKKIIHWYLDNSQNHQTVDTSTVTTQCALELIAWVYLVKDRRMISEEGFEKLPASDKIRLLLEKVNITPAVPAVLALLKAVVKREQKNDGPHIFTEFRNSIVHPKKGERYFKHSVTTRLEALKLGLWYLETWILKLLKYKGGYVSSINSPVENVDFSQGN